MITVADAAEQLGVSLATVKRWCASGRVRAERFGRSWAIDETTLPDVRRPVTVSVVHDDNDGTWAVYLDGAFLVGTDRDEWRPSLADAFEELDRALLKDAPRFEVRPVYRPTRSLGSYDGPDEQEGYWPATLGETFDPGAIGEDGAPRPTVVGGYPEEPAEPEAEAPATWGEALGIDEGPAFYAPVEDPVP